MYIALYIVATIIFSIVLYCLDEKYKWGPWRPMKPGIFEYGTLLLLSILASWFLVPLLVIIYPLYKLAQFCSKLDIKKND